MIAERYRKWRELHARAEQRDKPWLKNLCDAETSDAYGEDGRTTYEDSYMIGAGLWIYFDDDDDGYVSAYKVLHNPGICREGLRKEREASQSR